MNQRHHTHYRLCYTDMHIIIEAITTGMTHENVTTASVCLSVPVFQISTSIVGNEQWRHDMSTCVSLCVSLFPCCCLFLVVTVTIMLVLLSW